MRSAARLPQGWAPWAVTSFYTRKQQMGGVANLGFKPSIGRFEVVARCSDTLTLGISSVMRVTTAVPSSLPPATCLASEYDGTLIPVPYARANG